MSLFTRIFGASKAKSLGNVGVAYSDDPTDWFTDWLEGLGGGARNHAGVRVTPNTAMQTAAVWACVRIRSEDIGKIPCHLYRRVKGGGKERATNHPIYSLVRDAPNPRMGALDFRQLMQAWVDLRGNAYAMKEYDGAGRVTALWPIDPTFVTVLRYYGDGLDQELFYRIAIPGTEMVTLPAEAIFHLRGLSLDGMTGLSPIAYHRETIGLSIASSEYGSAFFGNSAQPKGILKLPGQIGKDAADALRADWERKFKGAKNAGRLAILDGSMDWVKTGMDNSDAQYLETRRFQNSEIWRIYRVPPHKVADLDKATFSNIEQQSLEYVTDCLMTEFVRWEQALARELLLDAERADLFFEFMPDALLRGDLLSRYQAYAIGRNWGWLSVNDICEMENRNGVPNGDIYLQPLNMVEAGSPPPAAPASPSAPADEPPAPAPAKPNGKHNGSSLNDRS